jgi:hypothetical protein
MTAVADQFQIGDEVLYVEEGIVTEVTGYVWSVQIGDLPRVAAYELRCGVAVPYRALARITDGKVSMQDLDRTLSKTQ